MLQLEAVKNECTSIGVCPLYGSNLSRNKEVLCAMGLMEKMDVKLQGHS